MNERRRRDPAKTEARCHQILDAAAQCFGRHGFRGASMSEVSKTAGMSTGHIYHYFASKEAIVEAIVHRDEIHGLATIEHLKSSMDVAGQILDEGVETMVDRPGKSATPQLMLEIYAEAARNPLVADIVRDCNEVVRASLLEALKTGQEQGSIVPSIDIDDLRRILFFIYDGITAHMALYPDFDRPAVKRTIRLLLERFLRPSP